VLKDNSLTSEQKLNLLLLKKTSYLQSLLYDPLVYSNEEIYSYVREILFNVNFILKEKVNINMVKGYDLIPRDLLFALEEGNYELAEGYLIIDYSYNFKQTKSISKKHKLLLGFFKNLEIEKYNTIYIKAILNHKEFSIQQKKQLCSPLSSWSSYTDTVNSNRALTDTDKKQILPNSSCSIM
jgi:hypothetical protein